MIFSEKEPASNTSSSPMVSDFTIVFKHRPELLKILTMATRKKFSHLIVYSSDRLARDVFQNALIKHHLEKNKVQIHFTKEGENFKNDSLSQKLQNIIACFAEFEASTTSTRVYDSLTQVFKRGNWPGGKPPFGFELKENATGKTLDLDYGKIDIIKYIFELYSKGYGSRKIADMISKKYFPYEFKKSTIEYILTNEIYSGILTWGKAGGRRKNRVKNDTYLIDDYKENFDIIGKNLQTLINLQRKIKPTIKDPQYFSSPFILKDLLVCSKCNNKLIPKNYGENKTSVYRCPTKENSKSHNIIKAKEIQDLVLKKLSNITFPNAEISNAYEKYKALFNEQIEEYIKVKSNLENKILDLEKNISNIDEMLSENPKEHVVYGLKKYKRYFKDKLSLLLNQLEEKQSLINVKPISLSNFSSEVHKIIENIPDKRFLCFLLIDKIKVSSENDNMKLEIFIYPKTLKCQGSF